nr:integrase, catalytic region, zinc finger, CCHC-type, peptidase aspartic, catalytic [Tanacetum cinerariifolium]
PPMLDRTDFASWKQRIRLYCRGKENRVNILKSINEGPFQMGTLKETLTVGIKGALHLGPERPRVHSDLTSKEKDRYNADIRATNVLLQGLSEDIYSLINHYTDAKDIWDNVKMLLEGSELTKEDRESQLYDDFEHFQQHKRETIHDYHGRFVTAVKLNRGLRDSNYDQLYAYLKQHEGRQNRGQGNNARGAGVASYRGAQNRVGYANPGQARQDVADASSGEWVALNEEQLLFISGGQDNIVDDDVNEQPIQDLALNVDNVFQADDCDAFDFNVDEAPTVQTMFMAYLSSADHVYDEASPSYDSDVLSEVHDHDHYEEAVCKHHEAHKMHDDVQPNYVVDSHTGYTSDSNMILYDQYVKDNAMKVVQSDVSAIPNDAYIMILNDMHEPPTQHVYVTTQIKVVDKSLTAKLATYKEQVELVLTTEIKEMKTIFYELEAEVDKNVVNRKCDEIEQKNLLIVNDTLISNCLSKEEFYIATNYELNVSIFSEMHDAHNVVQAHCLEPETELSKLKDKIQKDDHDFMVKRFSNLEVQYLNLQ